MKYPDFTGTEPCTQVGYEWFFPEYEGTGIWVAYATAKAVCRDCWIVDQCAEWAVRHEGDGVWGGLSPREREQIRTRRGLFLTRPEWELWGGKGTRDAAS